MRGNLGSLRGMATAFALSTLFGCARADASGGGENVDAAVRRADSLANVLNQREAVERKRVSDSISAERSRPRVLSLLENDSAVVASQTFVERGFRLAAKGKCTVAGRIEATSGGSKDVEVLVMTADQFVNWRNNGRSDAIFRAGPQTITNLDTPLSDSGAYRLVVSNRASVWTSKAFRSSVAVRCIGHPTPELLPRG